jgi:L-2,4-diaminobutyric acid acetyltransferase
LQQWLRRIETNLLQAGSVITAPPCVSISPYDLDKPTADDAAAMWMLASETGIESDASRIHRLFCRDLADTSVVARTDGELVGFASGYQRPTSPDALFVWKVAVTQTHRQRGVGRAMLLQLHRRLRDRGVWWLEASVPASSHCSRRLFQSFAIAAGARYAESDPPPDFFPTLGQPEVFLRMGTGGPVTREGARRAPGW